MISFQLCIRSDSSVAIIWPLKKFIAKISSNAKLMFVEEIYKSMKNIFYTYIFFYKTYLSYLSMMNDI